MIDELSSRQIISLSREGMSAEDISNALGIDVPSVKLVMNANSAGTKEDRDINDDELTLLRQKAVQLALYSADDNVSAKMTCFLIERDKPRKSAPEVSGTNLTLINNAIIQSKKRFAQLASAYVEQTGEN